MLQYIYFIRIHSTSRLTAVAADHLIALYAPARHSKGPFRISPSRSHHPPFQAVEFDRFDPSLLPCSRSLSLGTIDHTVFPLIFSSLFAVQHPFRAPFFKGILISSETSTSLTSFCTPRTSCIQAPLFTIFSQIANVPRTSLISPRPV